MNQLDVTYRADFPGSEVCILDVYSADSANSPVLVWFHGGGLTGGGKTEHGLGKKLAGHGITVVAPNYRLSPAYTYPAYVEDAAAAVQWTIEHLNPSELFIGGHSAGAYLAMMVSMHPDFLDTKSKQMIRGVIPACGQTVTHYTIQAERDLPVSKMVIDHAAPLHHVHEDLPPFLLIASEHDIPVRVEQNMLLNATLLERGVKSRFYLAEGCDHSNLFDQNHVGSAKTYKTIQAFIQDYSSY